MSTRTQKPRKWSSFGHRSELSFTFEFLRCVHFVHDISFFGTQLLNVFGGFISCRYWLAGWMSLISKICKHVYQSHRFLCNPYRSWEFHDSIKYQCPGETVPNGRRSWRALIYTFQKKTCIYLSSIPSSAKYMIFKKWTSYKHQVGQSEPHLWRQKGHSHLRLQIGNFYLCPMRPTNWGRLGALKKKHIFHVTLWSQSKKAK